MQIFKTMEKFKFRVLIKHCFLMGKNTVQAKQWLDKCYSYSALLETMVKRWYVDFKHGHTDTNDAECSDSPNSAVVPESTKKLHKLVFVDQKLKLHEIAEELKRLEGSVLTLLYEHLSMESCVQSGCHVKNNNASIIQSIVCNWFNTNIWQLMKHESTTSESNWQSAE